MASSETVKRTDGIVFHVTEHYGFIRLKNRNIRISKVHFDRSSIAGQSSSDLSKDFPEGTHVILTFERQSGKYEGNYHAIKLEKDERIRKEPGVDRPSTSYENFEKQNYRRWGSNLEQRNLYQRERPLRQASNFRSRKNTYNLEQESKYSQSRAKPLDSHVANGQNPHCSSDNSKQRRQYVHTKPQQGSSFVKQGIGEPYKGGAVRKHHNKNQYGQDANQQKTDADPTILRDASQIKISSSNSAKTADTDTNSSSFSETSNQSQEENVNMKIPEQKQDLSSILEKNEIVSQYPNSDREKEVVPEENKESTSAASGGRVGQILQGTLSGLSSIAQRIGIMSRKETASTDATQAEKPTDQNANISAPNVSESEQAMSFLKEYLSGHGAVILDDLTSTIESLQECPEFLKKYNVTDIVHLTEQYSDIFTFKCEFFCLVDLESSILMKIFYLIDDTQQKVNIDVIRDCIKPDSPDGIYLYGTQKWVTGLQDFVARHSEHFVFWNSMIWKRESPPESEEVQLFVNDCKAVQYFSKFVEKKSAMSIRSLRGHFAQAPGDIKNVMKSDLKSFDNFLFRNSFFFNLTGDCVTNCGDHRFSVCWMDLPSSDPKERLTPRKKRIRAKKGKIAQTSGANDNSQMGKESKKAFTEIDVGSSIKISHPCTEDSSGFVENLVTGQSTENFEPGSISEQLQPGTSSNEMPARVNPELEIYEHPEAKIFKNVIGEDLSQAIKSMLISQNQSSLNNLLLVRLNIGRKPLIRLYNKDNETSNHTLTELKESKLGDLQRILHDKDLVKSATPLHYGIKGTLHSLRTIEQSGKLTGLTIFCQIHENNDGLGLEIIKKKDLTAVVSNVSRYPQKLIYNYLRSNVQANSQNKDVIVLDVNGQLSGCDEQPHSSLGDVRRISCASSSELSGQIMEAIEHSHEYVVVNNVESVETLQSIQKMCSRGKVVAEISPDIKCSVEDMFGL